LSPKPWSSTHASRSDTIGCVKNRPLNFKAIQSEFLQERQTGTVQWLLESRKFTGEMGLQAYCMYDNGHQENTNFLITLFPQWAISKTAAFLS
jgi:hypothetical protein